MRIFCTLAAVFAVAGCTTRPLSNVRSLHPAPPPGVLVQVNGAFLTRDQAERELDTEITKFKNRLQAEDVNIVRQRILDNVVEQFIRRTLLLQEALRQNIEVTDQDKAATFKELEAGLADGRTLNETIKDSPMGERETMEQIIAGIRIKKLLTREISDRTEVSDAEISAFYENNREQLVLPEHVAARHILIPVHPKDSEQDKEEQRIKAERIRRKIIDGADFAEMAAEYSSCPSGEQGGNLGVFKRGLMIKEFDEAAFSRETGVIGPLVETAFGYHILQVQEHNQSGLLPREKVVELLRDEKRKKAVDLLVEELRVKADIRDYRNRSE